MNSFKEKYPLSKRKLAKKLIQTLLPRYIAVSFLLAILMLIKLPDYINFLRFSFTNLFELTLVNFVLFFVVFVIYFKIYINTYQYNISDKFISIKKGVFAPQEIHVQYQKIQDVYVDQDILDRLLGIYDVHIASATVSSAMEAHIDGVDKDISEGLKTFFLDSIRGLSSEDAKLNIDHTDKIKQATINFDLDIKMSNLIYPINRRWLLKSILEQFFYSIALSLGVMIVFWFKDAHDMLKISLFLGFLFSFWVLFSVGQIFWKSNYAFEFLPEYIKYKSGILSISERHLPYKSIQDVNISQSFIDRLFKLANINIENAAQMSVGSTKVSAGIELVGLSLSNANEITEHLKKIMNSKNSSQLGL